MDLQEVADRSVAIREAYHGLELSIHGSKWSTEEDALAFMTDAGVVARHVMAHEGRWPVDDGFDLDAKIGECVWWLAVLAQRCDIDFDGCVEAFLRERSASLGCDGSATDDAR